MDGILRGDSGSKRNGANLLQLWAFVNNKDFWYGLLQVASDGGNEWPQWLIEIASSEVNFLDAVRLLLRYSMIEAEESVRNSYMMHPVVNRWASQIQSKNNVEGFLRQAVVLIGGLVPNITVKE